MESFIICTGIFLVLAIIITLFKLFIPEESYVMRTSLILGIIAILSFAVIFLAFVFIGSRATFWPMLYCLLFCFYIYMGAKSVPFKTATAVFSRVTNLMVGRIGAGLHWVDPLFERATTSVDGVPNQTIDLQELKIDIEESTEHHTATKGIKARVKKIVFMLKVTEDIPRLFDIEGGPETVRERVLGQINFILLDEIGQILPVTLDKDKGNTIKDLAKRLKDRVNQFCQDNDYPYEIPGNSEITIGDTELEAEYYKVLAKKEFMKLEQDALNVEAKMLKKRLLNLGNSLLPTATENEKLKAAMVALKITPKTIEEKTFGVSPEISVLMKELADILKK